MDHRAVIEALALQNQYGAASAGLPPGLLNPALLLPPSNPITPVQAAASGLPVAQPDAMVEEMGKMAEEDLQQTVSKEVFASYNHHDVVAGCQRHPGDIVEAGMLASLAMPKPSYPLARSIPQEMITSGKLSGLQLEGILYACQRHQMILPNDARAGFFIGDAAGVGKGRQISGIVFDNFVRGRRKHIWFSISTDLVVDARRDLSDLGCHIKVIEGCQQLDKETRVFGLPTDFKEGVIFSTYATLVSSVQRGKSINSAKQTRLQQLVDWCGGDQYEGCLIFDECHKAKNFVPGKDSASTKVALAVAHIQKLLPKSRVLYCSATGVTDVKNMAFMERMGLWGEGAPFKGFDEFIKTVEKKGLGVAEMLAMEMKSSGMYVSRGLSYKEAEFSTVEIELTKDQMKMYDTAAHVWNEVRVSLEHAISRTNCSNNRIWSSFWAAHQRFFKQLCLGIKVPAVVREAQKALEKGQCVVIGLQTTGEASMESESAGQRGQLKGFISLCREILHRFLQQHFPVTIEGQLGVDESPVDEWCTTAKQMLSSFVQQIPLPDSTLDEIIDKLGGPDHVAEMTGRRGRIVKRSPTDVPKYELRDANDDTGFMQSLNVKERNSFMSGVKHVAIISDAASTGISLHADRRVANQRRRVHLTVELPWSADKAVQQLGRSHRSNQASGPLYKLMTTSLGGERRFAATVARRLQSLGALTKGDRRAATGADLAEFNFDTPYGRQALRTMYTAVCQQELVTGVALSAVTDDKYSSFSEFNDEILECLQRMCVLEMDVLRNQPKVKDSIAHDIGRFLNRILGLSVARQQLIFNYFTKCLDAQIESAKKEGKYNEGLIDLQASSVEMLGEPQLVFTEASNSHNPTKHMTLSVDRGMSWEAALSRLELHTDSGDNGFYKSKREMFGRNLCIMATQKEGSSHLFTIARPNTGVSNFDEDQADLLNKYSKIPKEEAESVWKDQHQSSKDRCVHGPHCKTGSACTVGSRCYTVHLLCGGIVTLMSLLETTMARYGPRLNLTKAESALRVVRAQLNSGERVVGIRYPEMLIPLVEQTLQDQKTIERAQLQQTTLLAASMGMPAPPAAPLKRKAFLEEVTEVCEKSLKKAMTPPVTIRNFFKAVSKQDLHEQQAKSAEESATVSSPAPSKVTAGKGGPFKVKRSSKKVKIVSSDSESEASMGGSDCEFVGDMGEEGVCERVVRPQRGCVKGGEGESGVKPQMKGVKGGEGESGRSQRRGVKWEEAPPTRGRKRRSHPTTETSKRAKLTPPPTPDSKPDRKVDISPPGENTKPIEPNVVLRKPNNVKKTESKSVAKATPGKKAKPAKQGNLMAAFAKADKNRTKECPICRKQFKATTLNKEINDHIDHCLIE